MMYKPQLKCGTPYDEVVSALQKMIRRGKEREALVLAQTLFDNNFGVALARRLMSIAAEDIGLANPSLVAQVYGICSAWIIGKKESKSGHAEPLALALCVLLMCRSEKNRETDDAVVVTAHRMKEGLDSAAKVVADHHEICLDSHTDRGRAKLREMATAEGRTYDELAWAQFYAEGALLRPHVPVAGNPWGQEAARIYGFDYEAYLRGYVPEEDDLKRTSGATI